MQLGGKHRNMTTEPFEEEGPEYQFYGEFKRQVEHLINTKTESNLFRPAPYNKLIGDSIEEKALTRRAERADKQCRPPRSHHANTIIKRHKKLS